MIEDSAIVQNATEQDNNPSHQEQDPPQNQFDDIKESPEPAKETQDSGIDIASIVDAYQWDGKHDPETVTELKELVKKSHNDPTSLLDGISKLEKTMTEKTVAAFKEYQEANAKQALEDLKSSWGDDFDVRFKQTKNFYTKVIQSFGNDGQELDQFITESGLSNNAHFIKLMNRIGASIADDTIEDKSKQSGMPTDKGQIYFGDGFEESFKK